MKKLKADFSISEIGKFRFFSGIIVGIGYCLIFNFLFRLTLRLCNFGMYIDEWSLEYETSTYYYHLISFTSVGFAFCYTTYLWMSKPNAKERNKTIRLRMAQINPIWIVFGTLLFLLRMFWFFAGLELTIENDFPFIGFLLPIFIFLYCWNLMSNIYRVKKPFIISILIFSIAGFALAII